MTNEKETENDSEASPCHPFDNISMLNLLPRQLLIGWANIPHLESILEYVAIIFIYLQLRITYASFRELILQSTEFMRVKMTICITQKDTQPSQTCSGV